MFVISYCTIQFSTAFINANNLLNKKIKLTLFCGEKSDFLIKITLHMLCHSCQGQG